MKRIKSSKLTLNRTTLRNIDLAVTTGAAVTEAGSWCLCPTKHECKESLGPCPSRRCDNTGDNPPSIALENCPSWGPLPCQF